MKLGKRKCKVCKAEFQKTSPLHSLCSGKCAIEHMANLKVKKDASERKISRLETKIKLDKIKTKQEHLKEAQRWFNLFIRLRDDKEPCISCQRYHTGQYHGGHYRTVGSAPHLRFNELQVHKQCAPCNNHLSGNIVNYRINLIKKIGVEAVESIEGNNDPLHLTIDDIKAIKLKYKLKCKELKDNETY